MSVTGPAVFYWQDDSGELTGLFFCFFLWGGFEDFFLFSHPAFENCFPSWNVKNSFSYVVMEISSECGEIHVHAEV